MERDLAKVEAAGSSPVSRFFYFPGTEPCGHACMDICEYREEPTPRCLQRGVFFPIFGSRFIGTCFVLFRRKDEFIVNASL